MSARHKATRAPLLGLTLVLFAAGVFACGSSESTSDSRILQALHLKQAGAAYRIDGDPFCTVDELLNDGDEVDGASGGEGESFLIASPDGEIGILARRPFAPDCTKQAKHDLKRLAERSG